MALLTRFPLIEILRWRKDTNGRCGAWTSVPGMTPERRCVLHASGDLEDPRLEAIDHLAQPRHPLVVARERPPVPDGGDALPRPEADESSRAVEVAKQERRSVEAFSVTPLGPLAPASHELVLKVWLHAPGRMRVVRLHGVLLVRGLA